MAPGKAVPLVEFRVADANAVYRGVPLEKLMDNAGKAVAREVEKRLKGAQPRVLVLCGKGNNGGDGYVAALHLAKRSRITVVFAEGRNAPDKGGVSASALSALLKDRSIAKIDWSPVARRDVEALGRQADVILDCLLGSGISGPARAPYSDLIALANRLGGLVVAVDVPSGFPFKPQVRPDITVTIEAKKAGMTRANSGTIVPVKIGFPKEAWTHTGPGELQLIPKVADDARKADRGVLAVVAGGPYSGAPALAALAAHACGVGLVHVFTPESVADVVRRFDPTLIVHGLEGKALGPAHVDGLLRSIAERRCGALALGPGLGRAGPTQAAVRLLADKSRLPQVIDADAIAACRTLGGGPLRGSVLTPHAGEFKALTGRTAAGEDDLESRATAAAAAARAFHTTVLLKGHRTLISDGARLKINDAGVSAMAVGGTGDVLTGAVGAMLAKRLSPFDAARVGAFLCGKAGELAFEDLGHSLKPPDIISAIPRVLARHVPWWGGRP